MKTFLTRNAPQFWGVAGALAFLALFALVVGCVGPAPCDAADIDCTGSPEYQSWEVDKKAENRAIVGAVVQGVLIGGATLGAGALIGAAVPVVALP